MKILVFCLPGIGDALLCIPALHAIKQAWPDCRITALTMFLGARELLEQYGFIDRVILFEFPKEGVWRSLRFMRKLRGERFDAAVLTYPSNRLEYVLLSILSGAQLRVGHHYRHCNWRNGHWLNRRSVLEDDALGNIEENLRLAELLTGRTCDEHTVLFPLTETAQDGAVHWLAEHGLLDKTLVGMHPGGSIAKNHLHKRWPEDRFIELGRRLAMEENTRVLIFGGAEEHSLKRRIAEAIGEKGIAMNLSSLLNTAAILAHCAHFVANDNALAHLAGALRVPATIIFGPTHERWVRIPGAPRQEMVSGRVCRPCFCYSPKHLHCPDETFGCLRDISAEQVWKVVRNAMDSTRTVSGVQCRENMA